MGNKGSARWAGGRFGRRRFLKLAGGAVGGLAASSVFTRLGVSPSTLGGATGRRAVALAAIPGGTLAPLSIAKYVRQLVIPPAMPPAVGGSPGVDCYEIAVRQFPQEIVPGLQTTVWSYGSVQNPGTFNYPAFTIEADAGKPVRVKWINGLVDENGNFLPHLLPVDPTLHWANPAGGYQGRDMRPSFAATPARYAGPVPMVVHLHGGHSAQEFDGYAEAWYLPAARNIPAHFARVGTWYERFGGLAQRTVRQPWARGTAVFQYQNDQPATTMWYHDHTLGMTRLNVYAGPAGFYILRGGPNDLGSPPLPGPAPGVGANPFGTFYEIPIAIQDRSFNADGSLFYPGTREFFDEFAGPYIPGSDVPPIWNPEFFGNTIVVNGRTWPFLNVERRRYRFRFLNGCNSRFLILKIVSDATATRPVIPALSFWQIGAEGGFLPNPVEVSQLLIAPAERADVIVDFTGVPEGTQLYLINEGPDEPFGGGVPVTDFEPADPGTTGQVMQLRVVARVGIDASAPPAQLGSLPWPGPLGAHSVTRKLSLNEQTSAFPGFDGPVAALLGTMSGGGGPVPRGWDDRITENPAINATEIWELYNFTEDAHPIHIHEVQFQVIGRKPFAGSARPPESWETGFKDTVIAYPDEITRVKAKFDLAGLYVWHCHIVEHEDNEMMRPYFIGPNPRVV
jgi:spore coat protein A